MKITKYNINISRLHHYILNFSSLILAILLVFFLANKTYLLTLLFSINLAPPFYYLLVNIFTCIFYSPFITLMIKYFQSENNFPLRHFIYIGISITTIIYLIIIFYKSATDIIIYNEAILLLVLALYFTNTEKIKYKP